ncbi:energy-coupling factor transporter transmembrane component T family protein [Amnibacterium flavum]|uniref:ABC transporter n=1 Tax=Amnibacterium flavum TaxID=2173173 RepID=A0A2V1HQP0_9MICO|nr:energy-coupling factor transporter transmembrane component T [Amnibacterium flavum]PVZ93952.1 ABC transporter [Amnibacterium flavum]
MTSLLVVERTTAMHRVNPVAKLLAALTIAIVLVLTIDVVSAGVALAVEALLLPFAGVRPRTFWIRTAPVWIAAPLAALTIALYGQPGGTVHFSWFLIHVSDGSLHLALATSLRVLAIGLPSVVLFITIDPTDLADGLAQVLHLPSRFVLGALAGMRLVGLFAQDWQALEAARRARGVADRGRIRRFLGMAFALLVLSVRRGSKLATAMEGRAFGAPVRRTWARESRFGAAEWTVVAAGLLIAALAVVVSVATGSWNFIGAR